MRQMMVRAGFPEERVRLMPHCAASMANDSNANELLQGLKKPYFLFAGRLEPEKGVGLLLEAARRLSEVSFVVAGAGSLAASIAEQAATLDNVSMLGVLNAHQLATIRREARAELAPSIWYEVFGMSALEAMQLGLPVIASDIGGLRDIVLDGETGLLIPPGDIDALATAIERLQDDPSLAAKLGAAGMAYVSRHHQPEQYLARLLSIYEEAAVLRTSPGLSGGVQ
jgi:glycosyltransferase involved in cell wall biosynthesis